jgi:two-component system, chemotaxis family, sensor kinase CheA
MGQADPGGGEMTIDYGAVLEVFVSETEENLQTMEESLVALEDNPDDDETLRTVFRNVHSLKGNAASVGLEDVAQFAHIVEDLLDRLSARTIALTPELATVLLRSVDALRSMVAKRTRQEMLARARGDPAAAPSASTALRVDLGKLDYLLSLVGEVAVAREQLGTLLESLQSLEADAIRDVHHAADRLHVELQEAVLAARMIAVGASLRSYARVVREAALAHGRQARLVVEGEDVGVDVYTLQRLKDPLTHIIRNSIAHGIEPAEVRQAMGKDPVGRIVIGAERDGPNIRVAVSDDGAGIDTERVRARAVELGMLSPTADLSPSQIHALVFRPGFSTTVEVSELSGRGVGLDVVRRNVESLRGHVDLRSVRGAGTTITIRLPLTVAIITGFSFLVAGQVFVLPIDVVSECIDGATLPSRERFGIASMRGAGVPFVRLRELWQLAGPAEREALIVVEHARRRVGLVVDALHGSGQFVIRPLGRVLSQIREISGSTITATGRVALIIDVPSLVNGIIRERPAFVEGEPCET